VGDGVQAGGQNWPIGRADGPPAYGYTRVERVPS